MKGTGHIQRPLFLPFSFLFRFVVWIRNLLFDLNILHSTRFNIPVISVGNITVGGTGKTPHVELLIRHLKPDYRLAVLSRGYKRKTSGFMLADRHSLVAEIGDEAVQIITKFPEITVAVDGQRVRGVRKLLKTRGRPEVIILDDAFQHRYIKPGLSILLIDYNRPVFEDHILPAGNLREPWKNSKRADIILVTKCPAELLPKDRFRFAEKLHLHPRQSLHFTSYSYSSPLAVFPRKKSNDLISFMQLRKSNPGILLVTAIANPLPVLQFLKETLHVDDNLFFADHHEFSSSDLQLISRRYHSIPGREKYIMVTEKDAVKLHEMEMDSILRKAFYYIPVEVTFLAKGEKLFFKRIKKNIKKAGSHRSDKT